MNNKILTFSDSYTELNIKASDIIAIERTDRTVTIFYNGINSVISSRFEFTNSCSASDLAKDYMAKWVKMWKKSMEEDEKKIEV